MKQPARRIVVAPGSSPAPFSLRSRGYLPHIEASDATYFVTFRTAGTLPSSVVEDMRRTKQVAQKVDEYLDRSSDACWLRDPKVAQLVVEALKHFDVVRYRLHAWCVMPNHVHVVFAVLPGWSPALQNRTPLATIVQSWKSYTGRRANQILGRSGEFWQREYYDHVIRNEDEFARYVEYTVNNPVKSGLCDRWDEYPWTGVAAP